MENREIELKLGFNAPVESVQETLQAMFGVPPQVKILENRYFDTPQQRLLRRHLAFRVRSDGKSFVQTLKYDGNTEDGNPLKSRLEWEYELESGEPELSVIKSKKARALMGLVLPEQLQEVFKTSFKRRKWEVEWPEKGRKSSSTIEVCLDNGEIRAETGSRSISEIELELKSGTSVHLWQLASKIQGLFKLNLLLASKSDRGYQLDSSYIPPWTKAAPPALPAELPVVLVLQDILRECVGHLFTNLAPAVDGRDIEGVHQLRVAIRRLRTAIKLFKPCLDPEQAEWWNSWLSGAFQVLSPARSLDVLLEETLLFHAKHYPEDQALLALTKTTEDARAAAYENLRAFFESAEAKEELLRLKIWVELNQWQNTASQDLRLPLIVYARKVLQKKWKKILKHTSDFNKMAIEERHDLRLEIKKFRYSFEFFMGLYPKAQAKKFRSHLSSLQDQLGEANDVAEIKDILSSVIKEYGDSHQQMNLNKAAGWIEAKAHEGSHSREQETLETWSKLQIALVPWKQSIPAGKEAKQTKK